MQEQVFTLGTDDPGEQQLQGEPVPHVAAHTGASACVAFGGAWVDGTYTESAV